MAVPGESVGLPFFGEILPKLVLSEAPGDWFGLGWVHDWGRGDRCVIKRCGYINGDCLGECFLKQMMLLS